jgi:heterodisulfide reductase subunit C
MKWGKNERKAAVAREYNWRCMECKTCEICTDKGDDVSVDRRLRVALKERFCADNIAHPSRRLCSAIDVIAGGICTA